MTWLVIAALTLALLALGAAINHLNCRVRYLTRLLCHHLCSTHSPASGDWHHGTPFNEGDNPMADSILNMNDIQSCPAGVTIKDKDGQPCKVIPEGTTVVFTPSTDPTVAEFEVGPDGMNGLVKSGLVGTCVLESTTTFPDGRIKNSKMTVNVVNSDPDSADFTPGTPVAEA